MRLPYDLRRRDWGASAPNRGYVLIDPSNRPGVETHHSVGLYGATSAGAWAKAIQNDHLGRGWTDAFYNVGVWLDGTIVELRPAGAQSGVLKSLTVCFAGNYQTRALTDAQKVAWHRVRNAARAAGVGAGITWHALRSNVACPGKNVIDWLQAGAPGGEEDDMPKSGLTRINGSAEVYDFDGQFLVRVTSAAQAAVIVQHRTNEPGSAHAIRTENRWQQHVGDMTVGEASHFTVINSRDELKGDRGPRGPKGDPGQDGAGIDVSTLRIVQG